MASFSGPSSKIVLEISKFSNSKSRHSLCVDDHVFNYAVEVTIPTEQHPAFRDAISSTSDKFLVIEQLPLLSLIDPVFIDDFVKKGAVSALSVGDQIDTSDVIALLPSGTLLLSLTKDTYQELGLQGKASQFNRPHKTSKFVVEVDLIRADFHPGKKFYDRVAWCFKEHSGLAFTFLVNYDSSVESTLLAHWSSQTFQQHNLSHHTHTLRNLPAPVIDSRQLPVTKKNGFDCEEFGQSEMQAPPSNSALEFYEWLGVVACQCKLSDLEDGGFLSNYTCPSPNETTPCIHHQRWTGFISTRTIKGLLMSLRQIIKDSKAKIPWGAMTVHGFVDSPISWGKREHNCSIIGDQLYTFLVFPEDERYWLYKAVGSLDDCP